MPTIEADTATLPELTSPRLLLRAFRPGDAEAVYNQVRHREISDWTSSIPHPYEREMADEWIAGLGQAAREGREQTYAITLRESGELVGCITLMENDETAGSPEIGFWIGRQHQGQGIASEANRLLITHAFATTPAPSIMARANHDNAPSIALQEKLGFVYKRSYESYTPLRGRTIPLEERWLSRETWEKKNG